MMMITIHNSGKQLPGKSERFSPLTSEKNKHTIPEEQLYRPLAWVASNFACWLQQHGLHHKKKEQQTDKKSKFPCVYRQRRLPTVLELSGSGSGSELGTLDMDRAWAYQPPSEPASGVRHSVFQAQASRASLDGASLL
jgi:hypothetical protein